MNLRVWAYLKWDVGGQD